MPLLILGIAIALGWWYPREPETTTTGLLQRFQRSLLAGCEGDHDPKGVRWALPVVRNVYLEAVETWCRNGDALGDIILRLGPDPSNQPELHLVDRHGGVLVVSYETTEDQGPVVTGVRW